MICQRLGHLPAPVFAVADAWHPYPRASDRKTWEALPESLRQAMVAAGEARLGFAWPLLPATEILAFRRDGNRSRYEKLYFARRHAVAALTLAECCEGQGRFLDDLVNGIWCLCEESSWSLPAHLRFEPGNGGLPDPAVPMVDLFAAETGQLLAWVLELLGPALAGVSTLLPDRIRAEIETRVLEPAVNRDDFNWMGLAHPGAKLNNWTPWIVSNWLACILLSDGNPGRREAALFKACGCLDRYLDQLPEDGGCDEGPSYWGRAGAALFDALEILKSASGGALDCYDEPRIQSIGRYIVGMHIAEDWFVNFADAAARIEPAAHGIYGYGVRTGDGELMQLGASCWQRAQARRGAVDFGADLKRALQALFHFPITTAVETLVPYLRDYWLPDTQVAVSRDRAGSPAGWFVAAKGGHNGESHNHNDVGSLIVYRDGAPLLVDAGVGEYTRQTFSADRYAIWTMRSEYHNLLPLIDGVGQSHGQEFRAGAVDYRMDASAMSLSMELHGAYPPEAHLDFWRREIVFTRGQGVSVADQFRLTQAVQAIDFAILTPAKPVAMGGNQIRLEAQPLPDARTSAAGTLTIDTRDAIEVTLAEFAIDDMKLASIWGSRLHRITVRLAQPPLAGTVRWRIHSGICETGG